MSDAHTATALRRLLGLDTPPAEAESSDALGDFLAAAQTAQRLLDAADVDADAERGHDWSVRTW